MTAPMARIFMVLNLNLHMVVIVLNLNLNLKVPFKLYFTHLMKMK